MKEKKEKKEREKEKKVEAGKRSTIRWYPHVVFSAKPKKFLQY